MASTTAVTEAMAQHALAATAAQAVQADPDPFCAGEHVVYPAHGVGRIERIGEEEIAGHVLELIQITFEENRMRLRIPAAKARAAGLRKVASRETFDEVLAILRGRPRASRAMWAKRAQEYQAKINSGDPKRVAEVLRDLRRNAEGVEQSFSERQIFESALERLATEFAVLENVDKVTAQSRLSDVLKRADAS